MAIFAWLSESQTRYLAVSETALVFFAVLVLAGVCSRRAAAFLATRAGTAVVFAAALLALLASRWPTLFLEVDYLDNDTAEYIAQAMMAQHHWIPWRDFDGLTSGPFDTYAVILPALLGFPLSFETTDALTIVLQFLAIAALYGALLRGFDAGIARLGIVPPVIFWSVTVLHEFVNYSSGLLSAVASTAMLWLLAVARLRGYSWMPLVASGILGGLLPFAKLQSGPLAAAISVITIAAILCEPGLRFDARLRSTGAFVAGLFVVPVLTLGAAWIGGSLWDFWMSYILSSIGYITPGKMPPSYLLAADEMGSYFDWLAIVALTGAVVAVLRANVSMRTRISIGIALVVLGTAIYCIYAPGRGTHSYLVYAVIPTALAAGAGLAALLAATESRAARAAIGCAFVVAAFWMQGGIVRANNAWATDAYPHYLSGGDADELVADIRRHLRPGERLAIWGYRPRYFVLTGTLLGTRDATAINQWNTYPNPYRQYYRDRFIADMKANRPEGFLDAGADSWDPSNSKDTQGGIESFPELAAIVNADYTLVETWQRFRLYVRSDLKSRTIARSPRASRLADRARTAANPSRS